MEAIFMQLAQAGFAKELVVFISSMFPIWELKGAIILAQAWGIAPWTSFFICYAGLGIGKKAGTKLADKAGILGGSILIFIGLEIFITSFF